MSKKRIALVKTPAGVRQFGFPNILVQRKNVSAWRKAGLKVVTGTWNTKTESVTDGYKRLRAKL